jgi:hypothetical protein
MKIILGNPRIIVEIQGGNVRRHVQLPTIIFSYFLLLF